MSRFSSLLSAASLSVVVAANAGGQQQVHVKLTAPYAPPSMGAVTAFGYYMSPYSGTVDGVTKRLNCVDFFHDVSINQEWDATRVNLLDAIHNPLLLQFTRNGSNGYLPNLTDVLHVYQEAAWLSSQTPSNPGLNAATKTTTIAIQTAIWAIASNSPGWVYETKVPADKSITFDETSVDPNSTGYWIHQAKVNYALQSDEYYGHFNIITDIHHGTGAPWPTDQSAQEFIYMSPEPGTWALLGTGFVAVAGVVKRKRRTDAEDEDATS